MTIMSSLSGKTIICLYGIVSLLLASIVTYHPSICNENIVAQVILDNESNFSSVVAANIATDTDRDMENSPVEVTVVWGSNPTIIELRKNVRSSLFEDAFGMPLRQIRITGCGRGRPGLPVTLLHGCRSVMANDDGPVFFDRTRNGMIVSPGVCNALWASGAIAIVGSLIMAIASFSISRGKRYLVPRGLHLTMSPSTRRGLHPHDNTYIDDDFQNELSARRLRHVGPITRSIARQMMSEI
jgi:hypothetical protein